LLSLNDFFVIGPAPAKLVSGQYTPSLVALSLIIAVGASYMALVLAAAARRSTSRLMEKLHLVSGSASLGFGIWSMHFIGMLAFQMPIPVDYDPTVTLFSVAPSLFSSWRTFRLLPHDDMKSTRQPRG